MKNPVPVVIGIDLGGTKIAAALVDADGLLASEIITLPTPARQGRARVVQAICELIRQLSAHAVDPVQAMELKGIGIGSAGVVDIATGTIIAATDAISEWAGTPLREAVRAELTELAELPVFIENDVHAYAAGEAWRGAGVGASALLVAAVGTGVGGVIVIDGQVWRGAHHLAGEIGHMPVRGAEGEPCTCSLSGHVESICAGPQIYRRYLALGGDATLVDSRQIAERAKAGEELAVRVFNDSAVAMGIMLAGLAAAFDPQLVIVSGGLADAGDIWWQPMETAFRSELRPALAGLPIMRAELGTTAPIIGAARGVWQLVTV